MLPRQSKPWPQPHSPLEAPHVADRLRETLRVTVSTDGEVGHEAIKEDEALNTGGPG